MLIHDFRVITIFFVFPLRGIILFGTVRKCSEPSACSERSECSYFARKCAQVFALVRHIRNIRNAQNVSNVRNSLSTGHKRRRLRNKVTLWDHQISPVFLFARFREFVSPCCPLEEASLSSQTCRADVSSLYPSILSSRCFSDMVQPRSSARFFIHSAGVRMIQAVTL